MAKHHHDSDSLPASAREFATTHWSVVLAAGGDSSHAARALARLCELYWYPLYAFVRRQGYASPDAQDLTQSFFAFLLQKNSIAVADPLRGRFRSFLLGSLKHFIANERARTGAAKRGGGATFISIDEAAAEARYSSEMSDHLPPDKLYEQQWARIVLAESLARLRAEYVAAGQETLFGKLKECLTVGKSSIPYIELARDLGSTEGAVKVAVHRLRRRYRELLRATVAETVGDAGDVEDELRALVIVLQGK